MHIVLETLIRAPLKNLTCALLLGVPTLTYAGYIEAINANQRGDYQAEFAEYSSLAEQGDSRGQVMLGVMYDNGRAVPQDYSQAAKWYQKAAEQGFPWPQYTLGLRYDKGQGVTQDYSQAIKWYQKAAIQGYAAALYNLGLKYNNGQGVPQNHKIAYILFNLAAASHAIDFNNFNAIKDRDMALKKLSAIEVMDAQRIATRLYQSKNFAVDLSKLLNSQK